MATATKTRNSTEPTPLYALVGATDLAVEGVRHALADAGRRQTEIQAQVEQQLEQLQAELTKRREDVVKLLGEPKKLQAELEQVPGMVLGRTMEAAAKAETRYEELAERGKSLIERLRNQKATQDMITQGKVTISRTKAAVTTARHSAEEVVASARETIGIGKREAEAVAEVTKSSAKAGAEATAQAAGETVATARRKVARTRTAAKSAAASVRKTAAAAVEAGAEQADS
jgi:heparin binding hemagglutinin HbhA